MLKVDQNLRTHKVARTCNEILDNALDAVGQRILDNALEAVSQSRNECFIVTIFWGLGRKPCLFKIFFFFPWFESGH